MTDPTLAQNVMPTNESPVIPQGAIDAAQLVQQSSPEKGMGSRFDKLMADKGIDPAGEQQVTMKQVADWQNTPEEDKQDKTVKTEEKPAKTEQKQPEKPAKDAVPEFGKKKEAEKPAEPNYDEELKAHPAVKGEAAKSFKTILTQRDEFKKQLEATKAEYEAKLKETGSASKPSKEHEEAYQKAQERIAQLENEVGKANYTLTPKFKQSLAQEKLQLDAAKSYLDGDEAQQAAVETASQLTGSKRLRALAESGMNAEALSAVNAHLVRVDELRAQRQQELENWKQQSESDETEARNAKMREDAERKEFENNVYKTVLESMIPKLEGLQKVDGYEDWNRGVDERTAKIKQLYNGEADLPEIAEVVAKGVAYDAKDRLYVSLQKKYDEAMEELGRLKAPLKQNGDAASRTDKTAQEQGSAASRFDTTLANVRGQ